MAQSSETLYDNYIRCHEAIQAIISKTIPILRNVLVSWHQKTSQNLVRQLCASPNGCQAKRKPSAKNMSCSVCIAWAKEIEKVLYQPASGQPRSLQWSNANSTLFGKDPLEVIKLFALRIPPNPISSLEDLNSASLLMIMMNFKEFHNGDQGVYDQVMKVSQIRNSLAHLKLDKNLNLDTLTFNKYWTDIMDLKNAIVNLRQPYFTEDTTKDVHDQLTQINADMESEEFRRFALADTAIRLFLRVLLPAVKIIIETWHSETKTKIGNCPLPSKQSKSVCNHCIAWKEYVQGVLYTPQSDSSPEIHWNGVISYCRFDNKPCEVAKLFAAGASSKLQITELSDFDAASMLTVMMYFREVHRGDETCYQLLKRIKEIYNTAFDVQASQDELPKMETELPKLLNDTIQSLHKRQKEHFTSEMIETVTVGISKILSDSNVSPYMPVHAILQYVAELVRPTLILTLKGWHNKMKSQMKPCLTPSKCSETTSKQDICNSCSAWVMAVEEVSRTKEGKSLPTWENVNFSNLSYDAAEVLKVLVSDIQHDLQLKGSELDNLDNKSTWVLMHNFEPFFNNDPKSIEAIKQIAQHFQNWFHMGLADSTYIAELTIDEFFKHVGVLNDALHRLYPKQFTNKMRDDVFVKLKEVRSLKIEGYEIPIQNLKLDQKNYIGRLSLYKAVYTNPYKVQTEVTVQRLDAVDIERLRLMISLKHPNIIQVIGISYEKTDQKSNMYLVTEFAKNGDLRSYLDQNKSPPTPLILKWCQEACEAVRYLHSVKKCIHEEIQSTNFLIMEDDALKLSNVQSVRDWEKTKSTTKHGSNPCCWMAPEVINKQLRSMKSDIWALGVVIWEISTGRVPFEDTKGYYPQMNKVVGGYKHPIPDNCPKLRKLLLSCWEDEYEKRPSIDEIIEDIKPAILEMTESHQSQRTEFKPTDKCTTPQVEPKMQIEQDENTNLTKQRTCEDSTIDETEFKSTDKYAASQVEQKTQTAKVELTKRKEQRTSEDKTINVQSIKTGESEVMTTVMAMLAFLNSFVKGTILLPQTLKKNEVSHRKFEEELHEMMVQRGQGENYNIFDDGEKLYISVEQMKQKRVLAISGAYKQEGGLIIEMFQPKELLEVFQRSRKASMKLPPLPEDIAFRESYPEKGLENGMIVFIDTGDEEFSVTFHEKVIGRYVSAFANTYGGYILFGVDDEGIVNGVLNTSDKQLITRTVSNLMSNMCWFNIHKGYIMAEENKHWKIRFIDVIGTPQGVRRRIIVLTIEQLQDGHVYSQKPQCPILDASSTEGYRNMTLKEWSSYLQEIYREIEDESKPHAYYEDSEELHHSMQCTDDIGRLETDSIPEIFATFLQVAQAASQGRDYPPPSLLSPDERIRDSADSVSPEIPDRLQGSDVEQQSSGANPLQGLERNQDSVSSQTPDRLQTSDVNPIQGLATRIQETNPYTVLPESQSALYALRRQHSRAVEIYRKEKYTEVKVPPPNVHLSFINPPSSDGLTFLPAQSSGAVPKNSGMRGKRDHGGSSQVAIWVQNFTAPVYIMAFLITEDGPLSLHPNRLDGPNCREGIYSQCFDIRSCGQEVRLPELRIHQVERNNIRDELDQRKADINNLCPYTKVHTIRAEEYDLTRVKLCVVGYIQDPDSKRFVVPLLPITSTTLFDRGYNIKTKRDPRILQMTETKGPVVGGQDIKLVVKIQQADFDVLFTQNTTDPPSSWQVIAAVKETKRQKGTYLVTISTPAYYKKDITVSASVKVQVRCTGMYSNAMTYTYLAQKDESTEVWKKVKVRKPIFETHFMDFGAVCPYALEYDEKEARLGIPERKPLPATRLLVVEPNTSENLLEAINRIPQVIPSRALKKEEIKAAMGNGPQQKPKDVSDGNDPELTEMASEQLRKYKAFAGTHGYVKTERRVEEVKSNYTEDYGSVAMLEEEKRRLPPPTSESKKAEFVNDWVRSTVSIDVSQEQRAAENREREISEAAEMGAIARGEEDQTSSSGIVQDVSTSGTCSGGDVDLVGDYERHVEDEEKSDSSRYSTPNASSLNATVIEAPDEHVRVMTPVQTGNISDSEESKHTHEEFFDTIEVQNVVLDNKLINWRERLGKGIYGDVYRVHLQDGKDAAAIKSVEPKVEEMVKNLVKLNHPKVVSVFGMTNFHEQTFILVEYMECGSLMEMLAAGTIHTSRSSLSLIMQAAEGLAYLHTYKLAHHDVGTRNCFLRKEELKIRIIDTHIRKENNFVSDVNKFGDLMVEVLFNKYEIVSTSADCMPKLPSQCPLELKEIISSCWEKDSFFTNMVDVEKRLKPFMTKWIDMEEWTNLEDIDKYAEEMEDTYKTAIQQDHIKQIGGGMMSFAGIDSGMDSSSVQSAVTHSQFSVKSAFLDSESSTPESGTFDTMIPSTHSSRYTLQSHHPQLKPTLEAESSTPESGISDPMGPSTHSPRSTLRSHIQQVKEAEAERLRRYKAFESTPGFTKTDTMVPSTHPKPTLQFYHQQLNSTLEAESSSPESGISDPMGPSTHSPRSSQQSREHQLKSTVESESEQLRRFKAFTSTHGFTKTERRVDEAKNSSISAQLNDDTNKAPGKKLISRDINSASSESLPERRGFSLPLKIRDMDSARDTVIFDSSVVRQAAKSDKHGYGNIAEAISVGDFRKLQAPSLTKTVGPSGGQLVLEGLGISLTIPPGALKDHVPITVSAVYDVSRPQLEREESNVCPIVRCLPTGQQFLKPVVIRIPHCGVLDEKGSMSAQVYSNHEEEGKDANWEKASPTVKYPMTRIHRDHVILSVLHFTDYHVTIRGMPMKKMKLICYISEVCEDEDQDIRIYLCNSCPETIQEIDQDEKTSLKGVRKGPPAPYMVHNNEKDVTFQLSRPNIGWILVSDTGTKIADFISVWHEDHVVKQFTLERKSKDVRKFQCKIEAWQDDNKQTKAEIEITNVIKRSNDIPDTTHSAQPNQHASPPRAANFPPSSANSPQPNYDPTRSYQDFSPSSANSPQPYYDPTRSYQEPTGSQPPNSVLLRQDSRTQLDVRYPDGGAQRYQRTAHRQQMIVGVPSNGFPIAHSRSWDSQSSISSFDNYGGQVVEPILPYDLMISVCNMLDGKNVLGNDWRRLASAFHLDKYLDNFDRYQSPCAEVLRFAQQQLRFESPKQLIGILQKIDRPDVAKLIEDNYNKFYTQPEENRQVGLPDGLRLAMDYPNSPQPGLPGNMCQPALPGGLPDVTSPTMAGSPMNQSPDTPGSGQAQIPQMPRNSKMTANDTLNQSFPEFMDSGLSSNTRSNSRASAAMEMDANRNKVQSSMGVSEGSVENIARQLQNTSITSAAT